MVFMLSSCWDSLSVFVKYRKSNVKMLVGSLIKLVYFSRHEDHSTDDKRKKNVKERLGISNGNRRSYPILGGRLHFVKFETHKINECLDFIYSKRLHHGGIIITAPFHRLLFNLVCYRL